MSKLDFSDLHVCVLAAGKGTRMRSSLPKVLHPVLGRAMIDHVIQSVEALEPKAVAVVIGHESEQVRSTIRQPENLQWVIQDEQLGTGHAVKQCEPGIEDVSDVLIVCGDTPLLQTETLACLVAEHRKLKSDVTVLTAKPEHPFGYGRIIRDDLHHVLAIVEEKDATAAQRRIEEVSSGIYCVRHAVLFELLHAIDNQNAQDEYYLPDIVPLALKAGLSVETVIMDDADEMLGVNDRIQLEQVENLMQQRIIKHWQASGVTIENPDTVRIEASVDIGVDTVVHAGCQLLGSTNIGEQCELGPYAVLKDASLGNQVTVNAFSHIEQASAATHARIGPYARLRPGAQLHESVGIGNFVEIKKSVIGPGSKVNHLSYIGDTSMGADCNIGAGTITCNYDGANKHQTVIGDDVFVGSDTQLVAPVKVGDGATIGAGSTITKDVPEHGLTLSKRTGPQHVQGWQRPRKDKS
jgi:bifunctional UDP-N-acetylglucosamine pyrophosphorylase/glucosamine-1-phosphate N-acetyltransferase